MTNQTLMGCPKDSRYYIGIEKRNFVRKENTFAIVLSVLFVILFSFAFYNTYKVQYLEAEVFLLKEKVLAERYYPRKYENADFYDDEDFVEITPENYDDNYDEESALLTTNYDAENIEKLLKGGNFTKEAIESPKRQKREYKIENDPKKNTPKGGDGIHSPIPKYQDSYHSPSYDRNHPQYNTDHFDLYEKLQSTTGAPGQVYSRQSRVMHQDDKSKAFRQVVSANRKSGRLQESPMTIVPYYNRRNLENMGERHPRGRKRILAIHLNGDTSRYIYGIHENYNGNGHLRHPNRKFVDWVAKDWVANSGMDRHFEFSDGVLTIKEAGLYFIYAQVYYIDEHDESGYIVYKNEDQILQCMTMTHSPQRMNKTNTCFTAGTDYFEENDEIYIHDMYTRYSVFLPGKSFFGVLKLGDIKMK